MARMAEIQNGVTRKKNSSRRKTVKRRNSSVAKPKRRNGTTKAGALSFLKKNGLKAVKVGTASNPKRRKRHHKRRNGIAAVSRSRNGLFPATKRDARRVGGLLGGMAATKIGGRILGNFAAGLLAQVGAGRFAEVLSDGAMALVVVPFVAKKIGTSADADNARLGGLAVVGLDLIEQFAPSALSSLNPFKSSPVIMTGQGAAISLPAAAAMAAEIGNSSNPSAVGNKVAGALLNAADSSGMAGYGGGGYVEQDDSMLVL